MKRTYEFEIAHIEINGNIYSYFPLQQIEKLYQKSIRNMPYSIRILLENMLRANAWGSNNLNDLEKLAAWQPNGSHGSETIGFTPGRVLLQDLTGVPVIVDLASLRSAQTRKGKNPASINPLIPVDLVADHSLQVDYYGDSKALAMNRDLEFQRNGERYKLLKWAQQSFNNLRIVPPGNGIVHQVNLEYLASGVLTSQREGRTWLYPDTLVGTDSHSTMINGLGVLGWGVGGIEAIAAMLGQPVEVLIPDVVGVHLTGELHPAAMPTDIVLTLTHLLRKQGVVNKFVEFFGPSLAALSVPDRAMLANMAPEYGATVGYFPVDSQTLKYLEGTHRSAELVELVQKYYQAQDLYRSDLRPEPEYSEIVELDLSTIQPSLAGPKRPQDLISLENVAETFNAILSKPLTERGYAIAPDQAKQPVSLIIQQKNYTLDHGAVVLAAITSCTNTSNPTALIAAGLVAKKAVEMGLSSQPYVKTSFTPGSKVVVEYLQLAGLLPYLEALGFYVNGFGCATCIGNSGPLTAEVSKAIEDHHLIAAAVISGNRNFEGRVHPQVQANFLASPALVVAYALAGNIRMNLISDPIGMSSSGKDVFLKDIMPTLEDIRRIEQEVIQPGIFQTKYADLFEGDARWQKMDIKGSNLYPWDGTSTYLKETPFCEPEAGITDDILNARALAVFGDSITTDHISPAGAITYGTPAAKYLLEKGIKPVDFNTYGTRRGNHEVMVRGTFANIRIQNLMVPRFQGGKTIHLPDGAEMDIFDAAMRYLQEGTPLIILAGKEYGTGSSRDWAAKGPKLLGVKAVIAGSFERIHRSNLVGMGILPLQFDNGDSVSSLGLTGRETYSIQNISRLAPHAPLMVTAVDANHATSFKVRALMQSEYEVQCIRKGGVFQLLE